MLHAMFGLAIATSLIHSARATTMRSVVCPNDVTAHCKLAAYDETSWLARAKFGDTQNSTGWGTLQVETKQGAPDRLAAFAAGYVEAALTPDLINLV